MSKRRFEDIRAYPIVAGLGKFDNELLKASRHAVETVKTYLPDMPESLYDSIALCPIASGMRGGENPGMYAMALLDFFTDPANKIDEKEGTLIGSTLGGQPRVEACFDDYMRRLEASSTPIYDINNRISPDVWQGLKIGPNIPILAELSRTVNTQSVVGNVAMELYRMREADKGDIDALKAILRVETAGAPLVEAYGLHALDMQLRSEASKKRLVYAGFPEVLDLARTRNERAQNYTPDQIIEALFGAKPSGYTYQSEKHPSIDERVIYYSTQLDDVYTKPEWWVKSGLDDEIKVRVKTVGSIGQKLAQKGRRDIGQAGADEPVVSDEYGVIITVPDERCVARVLEDLVVKIVNRPNINLVKSLSKNIPLYAQGSRDYIDKVRCHLTDQQVIDEIDLKSLDGRSDEVYQVTKMYLKFNDITVEVQVQTHRDRRNGRLGKVSHMSRDDRHNRPPGLVTIAGDAHDLVKIYGRRKHLKNPDAMNSLAIPYAVELNNQILKFTS